MDAIRGLAALAVLGRHWRNIFFVDFPEVHHYKLLLAIPYLLTALGHQAVLVFFLLSGFLIGGSVVRAVDCGRFRWDMYLTRRVSRLWLVLLPALLLTLLCDHIGVASGRAPLLYAGAGFNHMVPNVSQTTSAGTFLGNMLFLQNISSPAFGSNGALWTLSLEFWYYILFMLGYLAFARGTRQTLRVMYAALLILVAIFLGGANLSLLPVWLGGAVLLKVKPLRVSSRVRRWTCLPFLMLTLAIARSPYTEGSVPADYAFAAIALGWMWVQMSATEPAPLTSRYVRLTRWFSRMAFTLYAVHGPVLVLAAALCLGDRRWTATVSHGLCATGVLAGVLGFAYLFARATEFQTERVRKRLEIWLQDRQPSLPRRSAPASLVVKAPIMAEV